MSTMVVIDVETTGVSWDDLNEAEQEYLLKNTKSEEEADAERSKLGLYPLTGKIISIAMYNPDSGHGQVLLENTGNAKTVMERDADGFTFQAMTEPEILAGFWNLVKAFDLVITFNGRGFDIPYIMMRSVIHGIHPTRNLMPARFQMKDHLDLMEILTFYGTTRRFSLDFYCRRLGIPSPKVSVSGDQVGEVYASGDLMAIAEYNKLDVIATAQLYQKIRPVFL